VVGPVSDEGIVTSTPELVTTTSPSDWVNVWGLPCKLDVRSEPLDNWLPVDVVEPPFDDIPLIDMDGLIELPPEKEHVSRYVRVV
jgi:hypothetical protein